MLIKLVFLDQIYRSVVSEDGFGFEDLLLLVGKTLPEVEQFRVQYVDDEDDYVTIKNTEDLKTAMEICKYEKRMSLRLSITGVPKKKEVSLRSEKSETEELQSVPIEDDEKEDEVSVAMDSDDAGSEEFEIIDAFSQEGEAVKVNQDLQASMTFFDEEEPAEAVVPGSSDSESDAFEVENIPEENSVTKAFVTEGNLIDHVVDPEIEEGGEVITKGDIVDEVASLPDEADAVPVPEYREQTSADPEDIRSSIMDDVIHNMGMAEAKKLYSTVESFLNSNVSLSDDLLQNLAGVLSVEKVVAELQRFFNSDIVRMIVVNVSHAIKDGGKIWEAITPFVIELLMMLTTLVTKCPEILGLMPTIIQLLSGEAIEKKSPKKVVVHKHVICNGCNTNEYIVGPRYKSAIIEDFDLCSKCEAGGKYRDTHGPFLKIYHPSQAPVTIICVLPAEQKECPRPCRQPAVTRKSPQPAANSDEKKICLKGHTLTRHKNHKHRYICDVCETSSADFMFGCRSCNWDICQKCHGDCAVCPKGKHVLKAAKNSYPFMILNCDECSTSNKNFKGEFHSCRPCDYDLCDDCFAFEQAAEKNSSSPEEESAEPKARKNLNPRAREKVVPLPAAVEQPAQQKKVKKVPAKKQRPQCKFVSDVSVHDGSIIAPGNSFEKTWRVINNGKVRFPAGTRLINVGGHILSFPATGIIVDEIDPGHMHDITIRLIAPKSSGRYVSYFRLITPDNERFGMRLWVDIVVDGTIVEEIAANISEPFRKIGQEIIQRVTDEQQKAVNQVSTVSSDMNEAQAQQAQDDDFNKYKAELQRIADIGFYDVSKNIFLLKEFDGDVAKVINALISDS